MPEALSLEVETECEVLEVCFELKNRFKSHQGPCEDEPPLPVFVWDFLDHLSEQPGSCETDMEQFAETLSGRVTTDEALEELVDLIYQQATSVPKLRRGGARLCGYLSRHLTIPSQRGSFRQVLLQRCQTDYEPRDQAAKGDEAGRKRFHELVLFMGEFYLLLEIEGANGQAHTALFRGLLDALLSHPVDDNLICAVKLLKLTGPALEDAWKRQRKTDMDDVIQGIAKVALEAPCSVGVKQMLLKLVELRLDNWGRVPVTSASREAAPEIDPNCFVTEPPLGPADGVPFPAADPDDQDSSQE
ncbi:PREDICTED: polyadenylate-binding protein-interacting protein 1 [Myotis brandtii]|nr:PREDICTED: polyadenylate-binding protein-interacting protein 1 [Myotis brandtii]